ncbi:MAG: hypothetical protein IKU65_03800 [Oscillospiraceae bacterium]|nr:hypothetical protein [Oscillospiraceae bacterium]
MKIIKLIPAFFLIILLCGCLDYNEMNMQEIVLLAGVDGKEEVFLSVSCAPGKDEQKKIYTSSGKSFYEAVRALSDRTDKKMYWGHANAVVISEEYLARGGETVFDTLFRAQDVYLDIVPVVARGLSAEEVLSSESDLLSTFANEKNSKHRRAYELWEIFRSRDEFRVCVLPCIERTGDGLRLSGGAVMTDEGLRGFLSGEEMLLLNLITEAGAGGYLPPVRTEGGAEVTFEILGSKIKNTEKSGALVRKINIMLSPGEVSATADDEKMRLAAEHYLNETAKKLILLTEKEKMGNILKKSDEEKPLSVQFSVKMSNILGGE